ncbi:hypothetical protein BKA62DRAFT_719899 [Auriculariales sp. MPI-PUGE-AT-0066]|nr:hypothetical protein BKA62DRAFT_719899 [Auriculariales sp. MPI-PUGE-AT-0066]
MVSAKAKKTFELTEEDKAYNINRGPLLKVKYSYKPKNAVRNKTFDMDQHFSFETTWPDIMAALRLDGDWKALLADLKRKSKDGHVLANVQIDHAAAAEVDGHEEEEEMDAAGRGNAKDKGALDDEDDATLEKIKQIREKYTCERHDGCCYVNANGNHDKLTLRDIDSWAAAWADGVEGVDVEHPPHGKVFDPTPPPRGISRRDSLQQPQQQQSLPAIHIHTGSSSGSRRRRHHSPESSSPVKYARYSSSSSSPAPPPRSHRHSRRSLSDKTNTQQASGPDLTLEEFVDMYKLSANLRAKLVSHEFCGPLSLAPMLSKFISVAELSLGDEGALVNAMRSWERLPPS